MASVIAHQRAEDFLTKRLTRFAVSLELFHKLKLNTPFFMNKTCFVSLVTLITGVSGYSEIIIDEPFDYPDHFLVLVSSWGQVEAARGSARVLNGELLLTSAQNEIIKRSFVEGPYGGGEQEADLFVAMRVKILGMPTWAYFGQLVGDDEVTRSRLYAMADDSEEAGIIRFGAESTRLIPPSPSALAHSAQLATNHFYLVVTKHNFASRATTLWVSPTLESDASATTTVNPLTPAELTGFQFRQGQGMGTMLIDDLKIGSTFSEVMLANTPPKINAPPNVTMTGASVAGPILITVSDSDSPVQSLTLHGHSANQALVRHEDIVFGGTLGDRTVTINPVPGVVGLAQIILTVSDESSSASTTLTLEVAVPAPPTFTYTRTASELRLSWPTGGSFELQVATDLPANEWLSLPYWLDGNTNFIQLDTSSGRAFYRLFKSN